MLGEIILSFAVPISRGTSLITTWLRSSLQYQLVHIAPSKFEDCFADRGIVVEDFIDFLFRSRDRNGG